MRQHERRCVAAAGERLHLLELPVHHVGRVEREEEAAGLASGQRADRAQQLGQRGGVLPDGRELALHLPGHGQLQVGIAVLEGDPEAGREEGEPVALPLQKFGEAVVSIKS